MRPCISRRHADLSVRLCTSSSLEPDPAVKDKEEFFGGRFLSEVEEVSASDLV